MIKLIKKLITTVIVIVVLIVAALVGGYFYVRSTFGIDLLKTVGELKTLNEQVDEGALCPDAFGEKDMTDLQTEVNKSVENLITYTQEHGYAVNFDDLPERMKYVIKLTDKQIGALAQTVISQELKGKVEVNGKKIGVELLQVDFSEITEAGGALFNAVIKLDVLEIKEEMKGFPFNFLKKYVPDHFYISSTVRVEKGEPFAYTVAHDSVTVNNLSAEQTEDLCHTLNLVLGIGEAKDLNEKVGAALVGALVGSETQTGVAYSLKEIGATDFTFLVEGEKEYFAVECAPLGN